MVEWWRQAACADSYDSRFLGSIADQQNVRNEYCLGCEVKTECLEFSKEFNESYGLYGGRVGKTRKVKA